MLSWVGEVIELQPIKDVNTALEAGWRILATYKRDNSTLIFVLGRPRRWV